MEPRAITPSRESNPCRPARVLFASHIAIQLLAGGSGAQDKEASWRLISLQQRTVSVNYAAYDNFEGEVCSSSGADSSSNWKSYDEWNDDPDPFFGEVGSACGIEPHGVGEESWGFANLAVAYGPSCDDDQPENVPGGFAGASIEGCYAGVNGYLEAAYAGSGNGAASSAQVIEYLGNAPAVLTLESGGWAAFDLGGASASGSVRVTNLTSGESLLVHNGVFQSDEIDEGWSEEFQESDFPVGPGDRIQIEATLHASGGQADGGAIVYYEYSLYASEFPSAEPRFNGFDVSATEVNDLGDGRFELLGTTTLSSNGQSVMQLDGDLLLDMNSDELSGQCQVRESVTGQELPLFPSDAIRWGSGGAQYCIQYDLQGGTIVESSLGIAGLKSGFAKVCFATDPKPALILEGEIVLTDAFEEGSDPNTAKLKAAVKLDDEGIHLDSIAFTGCLGFGSDTKPLFNTTWGLKQACFGYYDDDKGQRIEASAKAQFKRAGAPPGEAPLELDTRVTIQDAGLHSICADLNNINKQYGPPVVKLGALHAFELKSIGACAENLVGPDALKLTGKGKLAFAPDALLLAGADAVTGELTFTYTHGGTKSLEGEARLMRPDAPVDLSVLGLDYKWDGWKAGYFKAEYVPDAGLRFPAVWVGLEGLVTSGFFDVVMSDGTVQGRVESAVTFPPLFPIPFVAGEKIAGLQGVLDEKGVCLGYKLLGIELGVCHAHDGTWTFGQNLVDLEGSVSELTKGVGDEPAGRWSNAVEGANLILGAKWSPGDPALTLVDPDGIFRAGDLLPEGESIAYVEDERSGCAFFVIQRAALGLYRLESAGVLADTFAFGQNLAPRASVDALSVPGSVAAGDSFEVAYEAFDADDDAALELSFARQPAGGELLPLETGAVILEADGSGAALATVPSAILPGTYYLAIRADDGKNPPVTSVVPLPIEVTNPALPRAVDGLRVEPAVDGLRVSWELSNDPTVVAYRVAARPAGKPGAMAVHGSTTPDRAGLELSFEDGLELGAAYEICVQVLVEGGLAGAVAGPVRANVPGLDAGASAPRFAALPPRTVVAELGLDAALRVDDADDLGAVELELLVDPASESSLPAGLAVEADGLGAWRITLPAGTPAGMHALLLRATDGIGHVAEERWILSIVPATTGNHPPQLMGSRTAEARVDTEWTYDVVASDPDGDALELRLVDAPAGVALDGMRLTWTPPRDAVGLHALTVLVEDEAGARDAATLSLEVLEAAGNTSEEEAPGGGGGGSGGGCFGTTAPLSARDALANAAWTLALLGWCFARSRRARGASCRA